jgi:hypothetical protein
MALLLWLKMVNNGVNKLTSAPSAIVDLPPMPNMSLDLNRLFVNGMSINAIAKLKDTE